MLISQVTSYCCCEVHDHLFSAFQFPMSSYKHSWRSWIYRRKNILASFAVTYTLRLARLIWMISDVGITKEKIHVRRWWHLLRSIGLVDVDNFNVMIRNGRRIIGCRFLSRSCRFPSWGWLRCFLLFRYAAGNCPLAGVFRVRRYCWDTAALLLWLICTE